LQLKVGGRLVIPVGPTPSLQELVRVTRLSANEYRTEDLADVHFVPLVGIEGWSTEEAKLPLPTLRPKPPQPGDTELIGEIARNCEQFVHIDSADLKPMMNRIGDARVVLLGESSHGTSEFYRMREHITRALIETKGFTFIAIEGDWPDAARIDHYVRHAEYPQSEWSAFARFPTWMWRNREVRTFVDWLRERNTQIPPQRRTAFYGLDLYSLQNSIRSVVDYLEYVDPNTAEVARRRYGCLTPWQTDPAAYGHPPPKHPPLRMLLHALLIGRQFRRFYESAEV